MKAPGAAESHQGGTAGIGTLLDRDGTDGSGHVCLDHLDHPECGLLGTQTDPVAHPLQRVPGEVQTQRHRTCQTDVGADAPEQQIGVGHRRLHPTPVVAGGSRVGSRTARTDPERSTGIDPRHTSTARADRVDGYRRETAGVAVDGPFVGNLWSAPLDPADVGGGSAHIETDHPVVPEGLTQRRRGNYPTRRAGQQRRRRQSPGSINVHQSARGSHHQDVRRQPGRRRPVDQACQVGGQHRSQVGVENRGRGALELAQFSDHLTGERHGHTGKRLLEDVAHQLLVRRIGETVEQRNSNCVGAGGRHRIRQFIEAGGWHLERTVERRPFTHPESIRRRNQGGRTIGERVVQRRSVLPADLDHVGEARGGDQRRARPLPLEQSIGGHRGAVQQRVDGDTAGHLHRPGDDPLGLIRSRRGLAHAQR